MKNSVRIIDDLGRARPVAGGDLRGSFEAPARLGRMRPSCFSGRGMAGNQDFTGGPI